MLPTQPDFLSLMSVNGDTVDLCKYYQACKSVSFDRQVGSRYFVSASNAVKIYFLKEVALHFLRYTGKSETGNKLETTVYRKLLDVTEITYLKADCLMFYHVYADMVMLSKSTKLNKSVLDMNTHYLELKLFLQEVEHYPETMLNKEYCVFRSEAELYGKNHKVNHRLKSPFLFQELFVESEHNSDTLLKFLSSGAAKTRDKLINYAKNQLPNGKYWEPEQDIKTELSKLKPSNDLCESILGLNDYLTTALPNLHSISRSALVEVKKNKTIDWLNDLSSSKQTEVIDLAVKSKQTVYEEYKKEEQRAKHRQQIMVRAHNRQQAMKQKAQSEIERLSQIHLVTSSQELYLALSKIDDQNISGSKKKGEKLSFLRTQVNVWKKVLGRNIFHIKFSHAGTPRPLNDIVKEISDYIDQNPCEYSPFIKNPGKLVGRQVNHRFELQNQSFQWFTGTVLDYDAITKMHTVLYEGEDDNCYFNLIQDLLTGDLKLL